MDMEREFHWIWTGIRDLEMLPEKDDLCDYARAFSEWAARLKSFLEEPNVVSVNQAKVLLLDKFFEWYRYVPLRHRMRRGLTGHTCVFQVFVATYEHIKVVELGVTPPLLFLPPEPEPPPRPPYPPQIAGIFIGEKPPEE